MKLIFHKNLLFDKQVSKIRKAFANGSSANIKYNLIQSGEILGVLRVVLPYAALKAGTQELIKRAPELTKGATRYFVNKGINRLKKDFALGEGSGITLTNNEIKEMKVLKFLENRGILLKGTTRNITSQEGRVLNFFRLLRTTGLPLMKGVLTPLTKSVLLLFGLTAATSATDAAIQKKIYGSGTTAWIFSNEEMEYIIRIVKFLEESG